MDQTVAGKELTARERTLAISWNIATEPKLYRELAPNPYSPLALQIILERFPDISSADIIKAIVLAEPEGEYDRKFRQLPKMRQEETLSKQRDAFIEINNRIIESRYKYAKEFRLLPREIIYNFLSVLVFETADLEKIEQRYSQNQRRDFRLSIVDFIENVPRFTPSQLKNNKNLSLARTWHKIAFSVVSVVMLLVSLTGMYTTFAEYRTPRDTMRPKTKQQILGVATQERPGLPVRLKIPDINIDAAIEYVGFTPEGEMQVPNNTIDVGWFDQGPRPGEKGSAVIAGHFNGKDDTAGVFINLYKLKKGDKLYIQDDKGTAITFVVRESRTYDPGYANDVFAASDSAHLNLITCDGVWNSKKKSYTKRLVVFTDILR